MSDVMFYGVLRMPYEMAMSDELSRRQFYDRVQEAADRLEAAERATPPSPSTASPLQQAIEIDATAFEATLSFQAERITSLTHPWGWRYRDDKLQEAFREFCKKNTAPSTAREVGELPPLPEPKATYRFTPAVPGYAYNKEQFKVERQLAQEALVEFYTAEQMNDRYREGYRAARTAVSDDGFFYTFKRPNDWANLLNPGQSWEEWTREQGAPTTKGWKVFGKPPIASNPAAEAKHKLLEERYNELIFAVARKFPGESRHETALRYIREAEAPQSRTATQKADLPQAPS